MVFEKTILFYHGIFSDANFALRNKFYQFIIFILILVLFTLIVLDRYKKRASKKNTIKNNQYRDQNMLISIYLNIESSAWHDITNKKHSLVLFDVESTLIEKATTFYKMISCQLDLLLRVYLSNESVKWIGTISTECGCYIYSIVFSLSFSIGVFSFASQNVSIF